MSSTLTVPDPLTNQQVIIVITAAPQVDTLWEERPILLSVGIASAAPTTRNGRLKDVSALLQAAWVEHGRKQAEMPIPKTAETIHPSTKTLTEATLVAHPITPPKPQLSLF